MARIAIDARLCAYRSGGIASYTRNLTAAIAPLLADRGDTLILGLARKDSSALAPAGHLRLMTPPHHRLERWTLPIEWARARPNLLHSPDFIPVRPGPWRTVITVHDLDFLRHPERLTAEARRYYGHIHGAVRRADAIIAVSAATRDEILTLTDANPARITVIHEAADPRFRACTGGGPLPAGGLHFGGTAIPARYFLFVGTIEPRKNLDGLLDAYLAYRVSQPEPQSLVIAGAEGWNSDKTVARLAREAGVTRLGPVGPDGLASLYRGATALLMPSWDEGFGLPVVEAMACGTPVAVSTAAALAEVAGDAALTAPPDDPRAWAAGMTALANEPTLRATLRARGIKRAAMFSWERAARETADLYARVLAAPRQPKEGRSTRAR